MPSKDSFPLPDQLALGPSIDDHEVDNLRKLCNEIFGEDNFLGMITRSTGTPTGGGFEVFVNMIDYILVYSRTPDANIRGVPLTEEEASIYDQEDDNGQYLIRSLRRTGGEDRREDRPSMYYPIKAPDGTEVFPIGPGGYESRWICGPNKYNSMVKDGLIEWKQVVEGKNQVWKPYQKFYLEGRKRQPSNLWATDVEGNKKASREVRSLLEGKIFDSPKPVDLIARCIEIGGGDDSIILDFFAGSGTTAHAVLDLNRRDQGSRKYILVQLPEPCDSSSDAYKAGYKTIAEITKERVRRVITKLNEEDGNGAESEGATSQDRGFRVYKLAESNFRPWNADIPRNAGALGTQLELHIDHIRDGRTTKDILYEILLKSGFSLTTQVETLTLAGKTVYSVADGALLLCMERDLALELIRAMAERSPERVVCLDEGFAGNDQLKTNAVQIFKTKGVTSFKTV